MNRVRVVLGRRGSGKSFLVAKLLRQEPRVVVFNTVSEPTYDDLETTEDPRRLIEVLREDASVFRVAYRNPEADEIEDFELCSRAVWCSHHVEYVVEEFALVCQGWKLPTAIKRIAVAGRHAGITLTVVAQRPSLVPATIRATCTELITFQQTEPRDIDWLREIIGEQADRVPELPQYKPLVWKASEGVVSLPLDKSKKQGPLFDSTPTVPDPEASSEPEP